LVRDANRFDIKHPSLNVAAVPGLTDPKVKNEALSRNLVFVDGIAMGGEDRNV
jgi:hypothetical protein